MLDKPLPRDIKAAVDLLKSDLGRAWKVPELARACGVSRRSLEKHFRYFVGCTPLEFLRAERLREARLRLLRAPPGATVASIAAECGYPHLGRFAIAYRGQFGESPSATLRFTRMRVKAPSRSVPLIQFSDRPTIAVPPFEQTGPNAKRVGQIAEEISAALCRTGWLVVVEPPRDRYRLLGRIHDDGMGSVRIRTVLLDRLRGRFIWADSWQCAIAGAFEAENWLSNLVASALRSVVRDAEAGRVTDMELEQLTAWELSMRALPMVAAQDPLRHAAAMELLERAIELAPSDPVPMALAAWCHGLRAGHHFTGHMLVERDEALRLAANASVLNAGDPLADTMLSAAYMLAHDLPASEAHARRALSQDGGSAWTWGRLGWVHAYHGDAAAAIEHCQIARVLAPADPLSFVWAIGIAAAHFELGRDREAARWYDRALFEEPRTTSLNRFSAPAHLCSGDRDAARQGLGALRKSFPDLTITQVRTGLPHTARYMDRIADGLESLGMSLS